jgi:hypothetical protein
VEGAGIAGVSDGRMAAVGVEGKCGVGDGTGFVQAARTTQQTKKVNRFIAVTSLEKGVTIRHHSHELDQAKHLTTL